MDIKKNDKTSLCVDVGAVSPEWTQRVDAVKKHALRKEREQQEYLDAARAMLSRPEPPLLASAPDAPAKSTWCVIS